MPLDPEHESAISFHAVSVDCRAFPIVGHGVNGFPGKCVPSYRTFAMNWGFFGRILFLESFSLMLLAFEILKSEYWIHVSVENHVTCSYVSFFIGNQIEEDIVLKIING